MYLFLEVVLSISTSAFSFGNSLADFFSETLVLFESVFIASVVGFLALSRSYWPYLLLKFVPMLLAKDENP